MTNKLPYFLLSNPELLRYQNFIGGKWQDASTCEHYPVSDPATDIAFIAVANSQTDDAQQALLAASAAFSSWSTTTARYRSDLLHKWHKLILDNKQDLAAIMSSEQGKPLSEAVGEVEYGASYVKWFAEEALRVTGDTLVLIHEGKHQSTIKQPVGVVAAITPWNFPLAMIARKFAPALAAGCTVIAKPAEDTPLTALALVKLAEMAGFPAGVLNIISASRENSPDVVGVWLDSAEVRKISFTGSTAVGKYLAQRSAQNLKRLSLELGGNAPFIVFNDADIDAAIEGLMVSKFRNAGQTCVCPNRVYVQDGIYKRFADKLHKKVSQLKVGPAHSNNSQIGPMINQKAIDKIEEQVADAIAKGANLVCGGKQVLAEVGPYFYQPTILTEVTKTALIFAEETFGPVVPLFKFSDEDEVVREANDTPFGLASYFYTNNLKRVRKLQVSLQAGVIGINEGAIASEAAPFGGVKESGYGREGSKYGLDDFLQVKYICQGDLA